LGDILPFSLFDSEKEYSTAKALFSSETSSTKNPEENLKLITMCQQYGRMPKDFFRFLTVAKFEYCPLWMVSASVFLLANFSDLGENKRKVRKVQRLILGKSGAQVACF
jgi:hypothetical protein